MKPKNHKSDFKWNTKLAYAVGLLVTDGNLSNDGRHFSLRSSDKDQLKTFKRCLNVNNKIITTINSGYSKKTCYRIQCGNVGFYNWLMDIGLMPNKSLIIEDIRIPDKFFPDFLRGHLDGDGCVYQYQDKYNVYKGKRYINRESIQSLFQQAACIFGGFTIKLSNLSDLKDH